MEQLQLAELFRQERKKRNVLREDLCKGICSEAVVARFEMGSTLPERMVLEALFSRLGISAYQLELIDSVEDFEIYAQQQEIEKALSDRKYELAEKNIKLYKKMQKSSQSLYQQDLLRMEAILADEHERDSQKAERLLQKAVELTMPHILEGYKIETYRIGFSEMLMLLYWMEQHVKNGHVIPYESIQKILVYMEKNYSDEILRADLYPKAVWLFRDILKQQGVFRQELEKALELLTKNGLLFHLPQMLQLLMQECGKQKDETEYNTYHKQYEALRWVYETYGNGREFPEGEIRIWQKCEQREVELLPEIMRREREHRGISQRKMADEMQVDYRTISRIERGIHKPNRNTFQLLKEYFDLHQEIGQPLLPVHEFEVLQMRRDINRCISTQHLEEAEQLYAKLREQMQQEEKDGSSEYERNLKNRQYVDFVGIVLAQAEGELTINETIEKSLKALALTKDCDVMKLDDTWLSSQEEDIVNYVATLYCEEGKKEKTVRILEGMWNYHQNSVIPWNFQYLSASRILMNLAAAYEEVSRFEEAEKLNRQFLEICMQCGRGIYLGITICNIADCLYFLQKPESVVKECYKQAFWLMELMHDEIRGKLLVDQYETLFGESFKLVK
ncbi:MAG: helix-turn-helix domain-containing protein [Lachnospiraceae bacterium]